MGIRSSVNRKASVGSSPVTSTSSNTFTALNSRPVISLGVWLGWVETGGRFTAHPKTDPSSGELKEKGSQKAVSSWWYFRAEAPPDFTGYYYAAIAVGLALGFQFVLIRKLKKGQSA